VALLNSFSTALSWEEYDRRDHMPGHMIRRSSAMLNLE
jgi:hypothetical protein